MSPINIENLENRPAPIHHPTTISTNHHPHSPLASPTFSSTSSYPIFSVMSILHPSSHVRSAIDDLPTDFSSGSPNHIAALLVLGVIGAILLLTFVVWVGKAYWSYQINQQVRRRHYPHIEHPQVHGWSWPSRRTTPPPAYEENQGSHTPLLSLLAVPPPVHVASAPTSTPNLSSSSDLAEQTSRSLSKAEERRQRVIATERQQTLMRLEGNPLAGQHISTVPDAAFHRFVSEMRLSDPQCRPELPLPLVQVPEPVRLRGGAGNKSWDIPNSRFSADDMTKHIRAWILKHTTGAVNSETVQYDSDDEQTSITIKKRSGLWSRITSKHLVNRAARKQAPHNAKRITEARAEALAILEGRF